MFYKFIPFCKRQNNASKGNDQIIFYGFILAKLSTYWKWNCSGWRGGGEVGGLIKMECPILFSAPPPHFLFRSAADAWAIIKNITRIFSA